MKLTALFPMLTAAIFAGTSSNTTMRFQIDKRPEPKSQKKRAAKRRAQRAAKARASERPSLVAPAGRTLTIHSPLLSKPQPYLKGQKLWPDQQLVCHTPTPTMRDMLVAHEQRKPGSRGLNGVKDSSLDLRLRDMQIRRAMQGAAS